MKGLSNTLRLIHIAIVLFKHGLDEWIFECRPLRSFRWLRFFSYFFPNNRKKTIGIRIREALEELGPLFVKFGQLLSTRFDIFPEDIIKELVRLQDQVPPFSSEMARTLAERSLGKPLSACFQAFDDIPLASASISQVHAATLLSGEGVVVKILRPNVHKHIKKDLALLKTLAKLIDQFSGEIRRFKPREIVAEFEKSLVHELDLMREAANASQLRRHFKNSAILYVPEIYWQYTSHNLLVAERVYGIPISNLDDLKQKGFNLELLAKNLIEIFFTQVFRDAYFHADLHPGNILVSKQSTENPILITVDFGIMGSLSPNDQRYLAENFLAFLKRDYRRVSLLHIESGWVPKDTRVDEFEAAIRTVCEPMFERPLKTISFGTLLVQLFQTAREFHVNIQPQLILLQKTLIYVEGLSRQLYPDIDLWSTAKPFLETWMKKQVGVPSILRKLKTQAPYWLDKLPELPQLIHQALTHVTQPERTNRSMIDPILYSPTMNERTSGQSILRLVGISLIFGLSLCIMEIWIGRHLSW